MQHKKLTFYILSLLLGSPLLCSCGEQHRLAVGSESSDGISKKLERYVNSDGGLGAVVINPEWLLRQCRKEKNHLAVGLQLEEKNSENCRTSLGECETARKFSDDTRTSCQRKNKLLESMFGELKKERNTIEENFEAHIADLKSHLAIKEAQHTEDIAKLNRSKNNEISTLTAQRDGLTTHLESQESQMQSLQKIYDLCVEGTPKEACADKTQEINTLKALNDDCEGKLVFRENQTESLQERYDLCERVREDKTQEIGKLTQKINNLTAFNDDLENQTASLQTLLAALQQSSNNSNYMQTSLGFGGMFFLGAVSTGVVGGVFYRKMSNRFKTRLDDSESKREAAEKALRDCKNKREAAEESLRATAEMLEKRQKSRIAARTNDFERSLASDNNSRQIGLLSQNSSVIANSRPGTVRSVGSEIVE
jgi:hypothetical protein